MTQIRIYPQKHFAQYRRLSKRYYDAYPQDFDR